MDRIVDTNVSPFGAWIKQYCVAIPGCVNNIDKDQRIFMCHFASHFAGTYLWRARKWEEKVKYKEKMLA